MTAPRVTTWVLLGLALAAPAESWADDTVLGTAQVETSPTGWDPIGRVRTEPWRFHVGIYGWLPEAPAKISIGPNSVNLPEDLDTIVSSLRMTAMLHGEVHKGPIGAFVSPIYYRGKWDDRVQGLLPGQRPELEVKESAWVIDYAASFEFGPWPLSGGADSPTMTLEPFVGGRFFNDHVNIDVDFGGVIGTKTVVRDTFRFNTVIVGLKSRWDFARGWTLNLQGDTGGWDVDDVNRTYQVWATIGYHFKMGGLPSKVFAGYRYLYIDWDVSDTTRVRLRVRGPLVGLAVDF